MANTRTPLTATDVMNATGASSSAVYRYLARFESDHPELSLREGDSWSFNKRTFNRIVTFVNRERELIGV